MPEITRRQRNILEILDRKGELGVLGIQNEYPGTLRQSEVVVELEELIELEFITSRRTSNNTIKVTITEQGRDAYQAAKRNSQNP